MPTERMQKRIDRLLDQAEQAADGGDWRLVVDLGRQVLALEDSNEDARALISAAERMGSSTALTPPLVATSVPMPDAPTSFANGRYVVRKFLGEGGKKKVYLAHDGLLDRDVAFALIKTAGLDEVGRERIPTHQHPAGRSVLAHRALPPVA